MSSRDALAQQAIQAIMQEVNKLQTRLHDCQRNMNKIEGRQQALERDLRRALLTQKEVDALPESVKTFQAVGKMFVLQDRETMKRVLKADADSAVVQRKKLIMEYFQRQEKECKQQLQELVAGMKRS